MDRLSGGIFEERELDENDEEFPEGGLEDFDEDETQMAEERPILDTSIIFTDREQPESEETESKVEESDTQLSDMDEGVDLLEKEIDTESNEIKEDIDFNDSDLQDQKTVNADLGDDDISMVIKEIEKKGDKLISQEENEEEVTETGGHPNVVSLPNIEDENVNIDEILSNPKMLTPTFGEILIAQKKFSDAKRVFTELSKKDPNNNNLKRKIEFLNKLVKLEK